MNIYQLLQKNRKWLKTMTGSGNSNRKQKVSSTRVLLAALTLAWGSDSSVLAPKSTYPAARIIRWTSANQWFQPARKPVVYVFLAVSQFFLWSVRGKKTKYVTRKQELDWNETRIAEVGLAMSGWSHPVAHPGFQLRRGVNFPQFLTTFSSHHYL